MPRIGHVLSPLLVGRDDALALAERRIAEVRSGRGQLLLVSGEAGIGKTRLAAAIVRYAGEQGFRAASAAVTPQDRGVPAASFLDLARDLSRSTELGGLGSRLSEALAMVPGEADPTRRRLVHDVVGMILDAIDAPTVLQLADLQWTDELSLELLTELARAGADRPLLLLADFRTDEPGRQSSLREWRSRVVTQRLAEEVRLERLDREQTALVTTLILATGLPAPRDVVAAVYQRTDGVPLHIEELLAALTADEAVDRRAILQAAVPDTLGDATLARVGRLSPSAQVVARAGAVLGRGFSMGELATVAEAPADDLDPAVQELVDHRILHEPGPDGAYDFTHQLVRDAVYDAVPIRERRIFHGRAAEIDAALGPQALIHASMHYERAGLSGRAFETALAGAQAAARLSSHRDAASLFERAVRNLPPGLDAAEAAAVHEAFGLELAAIDANTAAAASLTEARRRYLEAGDVVAAARVLAPLVAVRHLLGDGVDVAEPMLRAGLDQLEAVAPSAARDMARGRLLNALGIALGLALRIEEAESTTLEAIELARATDDEPTEVAGLAMLANILPFSGRIAEGLEAGDTALARAEAANLDHHAARIYRWVGAAMSEVFEFELAERWLRDGIELSDRADLWNHQSYMTAHLGYVLWATGRWDEAMDMARRAEADGRGGVTTQLAASYVQGYVLLGRGHLVEAQARLRDALVLAERLGEVLRIAFPVWGLAEAALLAGDTAAAVELTNRAWAVSESVRDAAMLTPSIVTGMRARLAAHDPAAASAWLEGCERAVAFRAIPAGATALEHARGLRLAADGATARARDALQEARLGWDARNRAWESAWVRLDLTASLQRLNRWGEAAITLAEARARGQQLGSEPILARAEALARRAGGRDAEAAPWDPLSAREFEVASLVAAGMTNGEIATELSISTKTASSHVEHILAKLGVARRAEIAAWASAVAPQGSGTAPARR